MTCTQTQRESKKERKKMKERAHGDDVSETHGESRKGPREREKKKKKRDLGAPL